MPGETNLDLPASRLPAILGLPSAVTGKLVRGLVSIGNRVVNAADATPGMAAILSRISCCMRVTRSGFGDLVRRDREAERLDVLRAA